MEKLPAIPPIKTLNFPPRGMAARFGRQVVILWLAVMQAVDEKKDTDTLRAKAQLLRVVSLLLLAVPEGDDPEEAAGSPIKNNRTRQVVRERLQEAEEGKWLELTQKLLERCYREYALQAVEVAANASGPAASQNRMWRSFLQVIKKVSGGCSRAAKGILIGAGPLVACQATVANNEAQSLCGIRP